MASVAVDRGVGLSPVWARRITLVWVGLIGSLFAVWSTLFIERSSFIAIDGHRYYSLFDDAMISMRYAWNFAHGTGLVWNPGQHVEGYTNLLMTLYMSAGALGLSKVNLVLFVQFSGIACLFGIALLTRRIAQLLTADLPEGTQLLCTILAFAAALAYYPLDYWALLGMETGLLALLLLAATLSVLTGSRTGVLGVLLGLTFMTRPDALLPAVIILAYAWLAVPHRRAQLMKDGLVLVIIVLAVTGFQIAYYHAPVPNTYTLKVTGMPLGLRLRNGWGFVRLFLADTWPLYAVAALGVLRRPQPSRLLLLALPLAAVAYQIYVGGDPWAYWRQMAPTMPLLCVLILDSIVRLPIATALRAAGAAAVMVALLLMADHAFLPEATFGQPAYQIIANRDNVNTAIALRAVVRPGASIAVAFAGALPYYSGFRAVDLLGKSDVYIAHLPPDLTGDIAWDGMSSVPGHNKYDLRYSILRLRPTYTQTLVWGRDDVRRQAANYALYAYHGISLLLDSHSPDVLWAKLTRVARKAG